MIGTCGNGQKYMIDIDVYEKIKDYTCYSHRKQIEIHANKKTYSLGRYILNMTDSKRRVILKNRDPELLDYRKENLFSENTYQLTEDGYYIGTCSNGETFKIDKEDYPLCSQYVWHIDGNDYVLGKVNGKEVKQHRLIMGLLDDNTYEIDHIHHDTHDNRKSELRIVDRVQNMMNIRKSSKNTSGVKGVYWHPAANKWAATISVNKVRYYLGTFDSIAEAAKARHDAEKMYQIID